MKINQSAAHREHKPFANFTANREQTSPQPSQAGSSSLNFRVVATATIASANQLHIREIQLDPQLENQRTSILELLSQYRWKLENLVKILQSHCNRDVTLCVLVASLSNSISINIRMVQLATTLRDLRQILDKLQNVVLDICTRVQNIASPPLLAKFVSLRTDIVLRLSASAFDRTRLLTQKEEILNRMQRVIVNIDEAKNVFPGQLSTKFIRRLDWGYDACKNDLLLAKWSIQYAQSNEDIYRALCTLRKSIARSQRTLKSVLRSPQRNFQERAFSFLGKLYVLRRELGETVNVPQTTTNPQQQLAV